MSQKSLLLCFFSILVYLIVFTAAHEAIIGAQQTDIRNFRYIVSLLEVDYGHLCGGCIIGERHILSAAHCFMHPNNTFKSKEIFALMGTHDLLKLTPPAINLKVTKVYVPREFEMASINTTGDIAVLRLERSLNIVYHENLKQIKIERRLERDFSGTKATIAGWGWNEIGRRSDSMLRSATADVFSRQQCQHEHPALKIYDAHLCAKVEQHHDYISGVCYGDDGGPLVADGFAIGVLSRFPKSCAERTSAAVYTRVSHYLAFIRNAKEDYVSRYMRMHEMP